MNEPHEVLTVKECAEYLRLSPKSVRRLIWGGNIKALKLGGAVRIHRAELEKAVGINYSSNYSFCSKNKPKASTAGYGDFVASLSNE